MTVLGMEPEGFFQTIVLFLYLEECFYMIAIS